MLNKDITKPPHRSRFVEAMRAGISLGIKAGLLEKPSFDRAQLMERAATRAGLSDFGDSWFEKPFRILLDAVQEEARLNEAGRFIATLQFEKVLTDRLWAESWFNEHPEILARPLPRPIFVVGPMRSGTTRLHRLLACDQRFNRVRGFETISPVPRPGFTFEGHDPRVKLAQRVKKVAFLANPKTLNIHPTGPFEAEEELGLLVNSMWGMKHEAQWHIPSFGRWSEREDATPAYRQMARLLKLIGWSQQASSLKPFVLKTPQHMLDLPALLNVFPDARVIFTHRDPLLVTASSASLAWNQTCIYSDDADPDAIGREWLRKTRLQIDRMRAARGRIAPARMIDIHYEDVDRDWRESMRRIYRFIGLDLAPALPAMEAYCKRASRLKGHKHRYSLAEFGLTERQVLDELGDYVRDFGVSVDRRASASG